MNYKKIFKSKSLRVKLLRMLRFVPDGPMLKLQYRMKLGRKLNLKNPRRFSEKLQWYKMYYRTPLLVQCADKYDVRAYVEQKGLGHILNDLYGMYENADDIDFNALPDSFVIKDTLGSGGTMVKLIKDKNAVDLEQVREEVRGWLNQPSHIRDGGREWPYYNGKDRRIIIEKYLAQPDGDLPDYKFFCINGEVKCLYHMRNYTKNHEDGELGFFDPDFKLMKAHRADFKPILEQPPKPEGFDEMRRMAEILSKDFPHVRVDFYWTNGRIVFGELTFTTCSGYLQFVPDEFDFEFGDMFPLPPKTVVR